jgi:ABC-2 type transport system ATP-binding protein
MTKALEIRGLRKTYKSGAAALKGVDLDVDQGDFFALLGPNGAGKSTTIGIVTALVNKSGGTVRVFGHDIDADPMGARRHIGLVPQEFNFNMFEPPIEVVVNQAGYYGVPRREALERGEHYLRQLGLWDKRDGIARNLSGGMKRRLMIARALVPEPKLLILDEPTAGVDIELRRSMWKFLREVNERGTTIILTTHYLEEAENLCRSVAIIDRGEIVENTSMRTLLNQLHRETLVLDLRTPLTGTPSIEEYNMRMLDDHTLEVDVAREQGVNRLFEQLSHQGIEVCSMRNKANRLEELFLSMVEAQSE